MTITGPITRHTDSAELPAVSLRDMIDGQTAGHLVVAADDWGWWTDLLDGHAVRTTTCMEEVVADGLVRAGLLSRRTQELTLTGAGRDVAAHRGFVRVTVRGWEPTFRQLSAARADHHIPAATEPENVARGCTDIARRRPEILAAVGGAIAGDTPGLTVDLGCADAGRIALLSALAPDERFVGVDIEDGVIADATADIAARGLSERISLLSGSVQSTEGRPAWLDDLDCDAVTTAMSFFLLHQLASDGGGIAAVLSGWMEWFPNLRRLVIGNGMELMAPSWTQQPWFSPTYEIYHAATGVRLWREHEYTDAFSELGWTVTQRHSDHTMLVTSILER
ncbi:hypothetical protein [uncultured Williamsia sp.]|uniref:hypothetical protein n=1 Tax=uncultured Williamsia sp. TaxID=259311 RepID=UPI002632B20B|nr:hypothetical protein [uncultured Williamsia sp.]